MNMKKTLALCLTIAICATMALGGTLAYLTDTEHAVNVMTVGNVEIKMSEQERVVDENGNYTDDLQDFTQNQSLVPAVMPETTTKEEVVVNDYTVKIRDNVANYIDKIVTVKNTGIVDAYVRTIIAIPSSPNEANNKAYDNWFHWNGVSDTDKAKADGTTPGWIWTEKDTYDGVNAGTITFDSTGDYSWPGNNEGWDRVDDVTIGGREYDLIIATNKNIIKPGEATAPSLVGFYLDERVDAERLGDGSLNHYIVIDGVKNDLGDLTNLKVYVATQAVQADGFADAWTALDEAFGDITTTNHPWVVANSEGALQFTGGTHEVNHNVILTTEVADPVEAIGEGTVVNIVGGTYDAGSHFNNCTVWAHGGATINIYDGVFSHDNVPGSGRVDMIYAGASADKGSNVQSFINIYGGKFFLENEEATAWVLNEEDHTGNIKVYGGSFLNFDPANNVSEGAGTNFVAEGYKSVATETDEGTWYTVVPMK